MVLEYLGIAYLLMNDFFAGHIILISHMFGAVFLVLTETTINMRIITPILDWTEGMFLGNIPFVPSMISAVLFIIWATFSIYLYQVMFQWIFKIFEAHLTMVLLIIFILITVAMNIKYRD